MPIFSAGNGGDLYDIGGGAARGAERRQQRDAFELLDAIEVTAPAARRRRQGRASTASPSTTPGSTSPTTSSKLTQPDNLDGCAPFNAADKAVVTGKIVWLEWDDNDATRRCGSVGRSNNAFAAGATGALFTSQLEHFAAGITGHADHPGLPDDRRR